LLRGEKGPYKKCEGLSALIAKAEGKDA
jgi:hypothetical protein